MVRSTRAGFLNSGELAERFGIPLHTLYTWRERGRLPAPAPWPTHALFWRTADIDKWEADGFPVQDKGA